MSRTTKAAVKLVIQTGLTDEELDALIAQADRIVTLTVGDAGLSDDLLKDIETWLTAHLIAVSKERQPLVEKVGDIWLQFDRLNAKGFLELTTYGQAVLFMDTSGNFQTASKKRARITAVRQKE